MSDRPPVLWAAFRFDERCADKKHFHRVHDTQAGCAGMSTWTRGTGREQALAASLMLGAMDVRSAIAPELEREASPSRLPRELICLAEHDVS
jgi:hypothetical protein